MAEFIEATFTSGTAVSATPVFNNIFVYRAASLEGNPNSFSAGLIDALTSDQIPTSTTPISLVGLWRGILSEDIAIKTLSVRNLYNPLDFAETSFLLNIGSWPGDALSPTSALSYRGARARTGRNRWRKRFSGLPESQFNRGFISPVSGYDNDVRAFGEGLEFLLSGTDGETSRVYTPVVLYSVLIEGTDPKEYRRPFTALEADGLNERVTGIEYSTNVSTQVTRKIDPNYVPTDTP